MSTILEDNDKDEYKKKVMSREEISQYLEDIAKDLKIDLSENHSDEEIEKIFNKMTSLSDEIIRKRGYKIEAKTE
jgi:Mg/Co/Ni transporter MgtE